MLMSVPVSTICNMAVTVRVIVVMTGYAGAKCTESRQALYVDMADALNGGMPVTHLRIIA